MPSHTPDSANGDDRTQSKKRRIPGACDICKKKKIRCDSGEMAGNRCSNCIQFGLECTHREVTKTLGSAKGYVESLEARLEKMDRLLNRLLPGLDVNLELESLADGDSPSDAISLPRNDEDYKADSGEITGKMRRLHLNPTQNRFFGKSSGYQLVQTALDLRQEYTGARERIDRSLWTKRPEFWETPPWKTPDPQLDSSANYIFPEDDLIPHLVDAYFTQINPFLPLLHRPTFEKSIADGLHKTNPLFGGSVMLVCALGSRYSDDPRVFVGDAKNTRSAGWKWFDQVNVLRRSLFERTSLYELQMHALWLLFAQSTEIPQGIWTQVGMVLRLAQEVGAHRRRWTEHNQPNAEDELWKRAFWVIVSIDRITSSFCGRPCGLQDEDTDLDLPLSCDDVYWDNNFEQPAGQPSTMAFFNCYLSLMNILAYAMRVIYAIKKPKNLFGKVIHRSDQQIIAELDSAMNNWMDSVPNHLKWNPTCKNELFLKQSAALYATYYHLQIFIHRPFIPCPGNPRPVSFPSLAICTNAARSCCHVLEVYSRLSALPLPHLQITAFTAAVILLLNIWSGKRSGVAPNPRREMEDVQKCMQMLKHSEKRWCSAGRYWDTLAGLACAGDLSIPDSQISDNPPNPIRKKKRQRDDDNTSGPSSPLSPVTPSDGLRSIAGSRRVSISVAQPPLPNRQDLPVNFSLPMYSDELGRLPVYGQFSFSDKADVPLVDDLSNVEHFSPAAYPSYMTTPFESPCAVSAGFTGDNVFIQADSFVKDRLFNSQFTSRSTPFRPAADLGSIFSDSQFMVGEIPPQMSSSLVMDNDTMTMWSTTPTGFELDEWGTYISNVNQMTHSQEHFYNEHDYTGRSGASMNDPTGLDM